MINVKVYISTVRIENCNKISIIPSLSSRYSSPSSAQFFSEKYNKPYYTPPQDQEIRTKSISGYRKHRIYPIFTKRSIEDDVELHHHRKTRRSLYVKIARMFSS